MENGEGQPLQKLQEQNLDTAEGDILDWAPEEQVGREKEMRD